MKEIDPFSHDLGEIRSDIKGIHETIEFRMGAIIERLDRINGTVRWVQDNKKDLERSIEDSQNWIKYRDMGKYVVVGMSAAGALGLSAAGKILTIMFDVFRT